MRPFSAEDAWLLRLDLDALSDREVAEIKRYYRALKLPARTWCVAPQRVAATTPISRARRLQLVLGRVGWLNPLLHQSELMMEAAGTNVTLHFSIHWTIAGKSSQLAVVC
jgi:hypothetical protein